MTETFETALVWPDFMERIDAHPYGLLMFDPFDPKKHVDITEQIFSEGPSQGSLFAYLYRRFGPPNGHSDSYKNLATWNLSVGVDDAWLRVTPSGGGEGHLSFDLMIPHDVADAGNKYRRGRLADWGYEQEVFEAFLQQHKLVPSWSNAVESPNLVEKRSQCLPDAAPNVAFIDAAMRHLPSGDPRCKEALTLIKAFRTSHYCPSKYEPANPEEWSDEHPLKPYLLGALATLRDLTRPVEIGDGHIDPYGQVPGGEDIDLDLAVPAFESGNFACPQSALDNIDSLTDVIDTVAELGGGDLKAGLESLRQVVTERKAEDPAASGPTP